VLFLGRHGGGSGLSLYIRAELAQNWSTLQMRCLVAPLSAHKWPNNKR
jgi:hypothetical protein